MNIQRLQLPDGTLLKIEGGDAQAVAKIIHHRLYPSVAVTSNSECDESPMLMPVMNFEKEQPKQIAGDETPLALPVMNFRLF